MAGEEIGAMGDVLLLLGGLRGGGLVLFVQICNSDPDGNCDACL